MLNIINNSLTIQRLKSEVKNKIESNNENESIIEVIANDITILKGDTFNILEDVYLKGIDGTKIDVSINYTSTPTFDINKEGSYLIEYETTYLNKTYTKSRIIEVIDTPYYALKLINEIDELNSKVNNLTNKSNNNNIFLQTYPVGSIYISTSSTNPGTIYGGTWERYGNGKTLVGVNESETEFATVNQTGGEKTHTLTIDEMPSHNHTHPNYGHTFSWGDTSSTLSYNTGKMLASSGTGNELTSYQNKNNSTNYTGGSGAHNNLQPYITVYMFKRTN